MDSVWTELCTGIAASIISSSSCLSTNRLNPSLFEAWLPSPRVSRPERTLATTIIKQARLGHISGRQPDLADGNEAHQQALALFFNYHR